MIQNDCMTTYVDLICDRCFLCTHNSASLGLFPSAPARVHSNIDIDIDIDIPTMSPLAYHGKSIGFQLVI